MVGELTPEWQMETLLHLYQLPYECIRWLDEDLAS